MRSGFAAGDGDFLETMAEIRNLTAPQLPGPIQHASAAVWSEEQHVTSIRQAYRTKFDICDQMLKGKFGYKRPAAGFFLWLDVSQLGGGIDTTVTFWKQAGVKVTPGAFLAQDDRNGFNPGRDYIRVALVHDPKTIQEALHKDCVRNSVSLSSAYVVREYRRRPPKLLPDNSGAETSRHGSPKSFGTAAHQRQLGCRAEPHDVVRRRPKPDPRDEWQSAQHLLGPLGAIMSDLLMQTLGLAGHIALLPVAFWASQLITAAASPI